jgi:hypothetical protein
MNKVKRVVNSQRIYRQIGTNILGERKEKKQKNEDRILVIVHPTS